MGVMAPAYNLLLQYIGVYYVYNIMVMCFMYVYGDVFYVWWCVLCTYMVMCFMYNIMVMCYVRWCVMYGDVFYVYGDVFYAYGDVFYVW